MDVKNLGFQYMREETIKAVSERAGLSATPDQTWYPFVFDRKFADLRHAPTVFSSQLRSVISSLFELLSDEERARVLPGVFDIGNSQTVPIEAQTYSALERELGHELNGSNSLIKPIRREVTKLLGLSINDYLTIDRSMTLKVLKLLYRYQKGFEGGLGSRELFSFLKVPDVRASFEFRPSFEGMGFPAAKDAVDKQRIIDELKVHLGSELGSDLRERVRLTFLRLALDVGIVEDELKNRLKRKFRHDRENYRKACVHVMEKIDKLGKTEYSRRKKQRLDLDMLIYIDRLQIENRNKANADLFSALKQTKIPVRSVESAVIRFNATFDPNCRGSDVNMIVCEWSELRLFLDHWSEELKHIMEQAFGLSITSEQYKLAASNALKCLELDPATFLQPLPITLLDVLGSLCMAYAYEKAPNSFRYKPYWHGQKNQTDRPLYHLNKSGSISPEEIPEGRVIYWRECRRWIKSSLIDQLTYWEMELEIGLRINNNVSKIMENHDLNSMSIFVNDLTNFATTYC